MPKHSAGLLMYRHSSGALEVLLVHPGGPFWAKKDLGAWSIPKGEYAKDEEPVKAAIREFQEETGFVFSGNLRDLGDIRQAGGKVVAAWCFEGDCDPDDLVSNLCQIEWPPKTGRTLTFPEVDRGAWFSIAEARDRILRSQSPFLDRLLSSIAAVPMDAAFEPS